MRILPVFIPHEGCPHDCVFCNQRKITSVTGEINASAVADQIQRAFARQGGLQAQAAFYGGSFTAIPPERQQALLEALAPMLSSGQLSGIRISTRPDCIDKKTLERLWRFGVDTIELGAQSMDERVLRLSGRGHTPEHTRQASHMIKEYGFKLILQLMAGLPGDSRTACVKSAYECAATLPDGVRIYPVAVLRDTALYTAYVRGDYTPLSPEDGAEWAADMLEIFADAEIPVIRIGLNPSEELSGGEVVAGAYHPALGEMARSALLYRRARAALLNTECRGRPAVIFVSPGMESAMAGQRRANTLRLCEEFGLKELRIRPKTELAQYHICAEIIF